MECSSCNESRCEMDNKTSESRDEVVAILIRRLSKKCNHTTASNKDTTSYETRTHGFARS